MNSKYDSEKQLSQFMDENQVVINFEVDINMKYGDELGKKVLNKYLETWEADIEELKKDFKTRHMKQLFDSIFDEIATFKDVHPTYGKLFSKIRSYVLMKLDLA